MIWDYFKLFRLWIIRHPSRRIRSMATSWLIVYFYKKITPSHLQCKVMQYFCIKTAEIFFGAVYWVRVALGLVGQRGMSSGKGPGSKFCKQYLSSSMVSSHYQDVCGRNSSNITSRPAHYDVLMIQTDMHYTWLLWMQRPRPQYITGKSAVQNLVMLLYRGSRDLITIMCRSASSKFEALVVP